MKKRIFKMAAAALTALTMLCQLVPALADDSAATTLTGPGYTVIPGDLKVEIGGGSQGNGNWSIYKPNSVTNGMTIGNDRTKKFVSYYSGKFSYV